MRFTLQHTADGSLTVFDSEAGECFKSRHAAHTEAEHVFFRPAVEENPLRKRAAPFRVLELGLGLGTNFLYFLERGFSGEFWTIERDLAGANFYLEQESIPALRALIHEGEFHEGSMKARLLRGDFLEQMRDLPAESFHAVLFDPFSPKANPEAWTTEIFRAAAQLLAREGRLVTYSVSRAAKDAAAAAGLQVEKRDLPEVLHKRSALMARKV